MTTAARPARCPPTAGLISVMQPAGVQGTDRRPRPLASRPTLTGWKSVDVLFRRGPLRSPALVDVRRQRQLDEDAVDRRVAVEPLDESQEASASVVSAGSVVLHGMEADLLGLPRPCRRHSLGWRDRRRPARRPALGLCRCRRCRWRLRLPYSPDDRVGDGAAVDQAGRCPQRKTTVRTPLRSTRCSR